MGSVFEQPWSGRHILITQRLRHRRDELGFTQKQVVSRLGRLGVVTTNRALSSLEHGAGLDIAKLPELAHVLECTITYLVGLTDDPASWQPDPEVAMLHPHQTPHTHPNRAPHAHPHRGAHEHPEIATPDITTPDITTPDITTPDTTPTARQVSCILGAEIPDRVRRA